MTKENDEVPKKRRRIGLIIDWLGGTYQSEIWRGVRDAAEAADVNLFCFSGGSLKSPYGFLAQSNRLYELVGAESVDGLVIATGSIADYVSAAEIEAFCRQFQPLPMVSIAIEIAGLSSVLVDNGAGVSAAVTHLIKAHGQRQIAYLRGPEEHQEANERFAAYQDSLLQHGLPFQPELVVMGDFTEISALKALDELLARGKPIEAIIAADDTMALAVMNELKRRGIQVPQAMAVIGFDDMSESQFSNPSLTTVHQPVYEQGKKAVELLLAQIEGAPLATLRLPTELVIRESCACLDKNLLEVQMPKVPNADFAAAQASLSAEIQHLAPQFAAVQPAFWDNFQQSLQQPDNHNFLYFLQNLLDSAAPADDKLSAWRSFVSRFRAQILPNLDRALLPHAEDLFQQIRILVSSYFLRKHALSRLLDARRSLIARDVGQALISTLNIDELLRQIEDVLPYLGIQSGYIALHEKTNLHQARLLFAQKNKERNQAAEGQIFPAKTLLPVGLLDEAARFAFAVEPLFFREEHIGFVLMSLDSKDGTLYTTIRQQLSSALRGALLLEEYRKISEELQDYQDHLHDLVKSRTTDLAKTNEQLEREILERREAEAQIRRLNEALEDRVTARTADLQAANERLQILSRSKDEFVSNVSHEFRTPIANLSLYLQLLQRRPEKLSDYTEVLKREVERLSSLIEALLLLSRMDQARLEVNFRAVDLNRMAADFVNDRLALAQAKGLELQLQTEAALPSIQADESLLGQVLSILLTNALNYTQAGGKVRVQSKIRALNGYRWAGMSVIDSGMGIPPDEQAQLFARFFRGKAGKMFKIPGTGLGLAIAKQIIDLHAGEIEVFSTGIAGQGTEFCFWLRIED